MRDAANHYEALSPRAAPRPGLAVFSFLATQHEMNGQPVPRPYLEILADPPTDVAPDVTTNAYVSDARWVVDCPFCSAAELAHPEDRVYLCYHCFNGKVDGRLVEVVWPSDEDRELIEKYLHRRPSENQHWFVGETPDDLRLENEANGITS